MYFIALVWLFEFRIWTTTLGSGHWKADGLFRVVVNFRFRDVDATHSVYPLKLRIWTPTLGCGLSIWAYRFTRFRLAPRVEDAYPYALVGFFSWDMNSYSSVWFLELGIQTSPLWSGPWRFRYVFLRRAMVC